MCVSIYSDYHNQLHVSKLQLLITSAYPFSSWVLNWSLIKKQFSLLTRTVALKVVDIMKMWDIKITVIRVSGKALSWCTSICVASVN